MNSDTRLNKTSLFMEILNPQDKNLLSLWSQANKHSLAYDDKLRCQCFLLNSPQHKLSSVSKLNINHQYLVFQVYLYSLDFFNIEVHIKDLKGMSKRLIFSYGSNKKNLQSTEERSRKNSSEKLNMSSSKDTSRIYSTSTRDNKTVFNNRTNSSHKYNNINIKNNVNANVNKKHLASNISKTSSEPSYLHNNHFHSRIHLSKLSTGVWMNLSLDISSFSSLAFQNTTLQSIDRIEVSGNIKLRKIFAMKSFLGFSDLPKNIRFPQHETIVNNSLNSGNYRDSFSHEYLEGGSQEAQYREEQTRFSNYQQANQSNNYSKGYHIGEISIRENMINFNNSINSKDGRVVDVLGVSDRSILIEKGERYYDNIHYNPTVNDHIDQASINIDNSKGKYLDTNNDNNIKSKGNRKSKSLLNSPSNNRVNHDLIYGRLDFIQNKERSFRSIKSLNSNYSKLSEVYYLSKVKNNIKNYGLQSFDKDKDRHSGSKSSDQYKYRIISTEKLQDYYNEMNSNNHELNLSNRNNDHNSNSYSKMNIVGLNSSIDSKRTSYKLFRDNFFDQKYDDYSSILDPQASKGNKVKESTNQIKTKDKRNKEYTPPYTVNLEEIK